MKLSRARIYGQELIVYLDDEYIQRVLAER